MKWLRVLPVACAASSAVYLTAVRPRVIRAGATDQELESPFPGEGMIPGGTRSATMATTIEAPPSKVWPWLVQMGTDRGGWYSWDKLDNFGRKSADRIHPEWQPIAVGDKFFGTTDGSQSWLVAECEPDRFLSLRMSLDLRGRAFDPGGPRPRFFTDSTWSFLLSETEDGKTRLVVSGYWALRPKWLQPLVSVFLLEPSHWVMQKRQFANLKRLAEKANQDAGQGSVEVAKGVGVE
ncbi:MAG: SRPBCC domain-containing protein [Dehalococcoidia bacterium]